MSAISFGKLDPATAAWLLEKPKKEDLKEACFYRCYRAIRAAYNERVDEENKSQKVRWLPMPYSMEDADELRKFLEGNAEEIAQVRSLDLSNLGLTQVPEEIFRYFKGLRTLDLKRNELTELSPLIRDLTELKALCVDDNRLRDLPWGLSRLSRLRALAASRNQFQKFPSVIGRLGLQFLALEDAFPERKIIHIPSDSRWWSRLFFLSFNSKITNPLIGFERHQPFKRLGYLGIRGVELNYPIANQVRVNPNLYLDLDSRTSETGLGPWDRVVLSLRNLGLGLPRARISEEEGDLEINRGLGHKPLP